MSSLSETAGQGHHQYPYLSRELEDCRADTDIGVRKERLVCLVLLSARSLQQHKHHINAASRRAGVTRIAMVLTRHIRCSCEE